MKHTDEKRQDLLLDALSCIDDDILAKGLALRDREAAAKTEAVLTPLFDLAELDRKPPRRTPRRAILVAAAVLILFSVIPLSMWLVASQSKDAPGTNDPTYGTPLESEAAADTAPMSDLSQEGAVPNAPGEAPLPAETDMLPEVSPSESIPELEPDTEGVWWGDEETMSVEINPPEYEPPYTEYDSPEWRVISNTNSQVTYLTQCQNGVSVTLSAVVQTASSPQEEVSAEDEAVLKLIGQWMMSVYALDYANHFPLFHPSVVQDRFLSQIDETGMTYQEAITRIQRAQEDLFPIKELDLILTLEDNRLLTEDELEAYRQKTGLSITSARCFALHGMIVYNGILSSDQWMEGAEFICYESDGVWYLDDSLLEDDLCVDLAQNSPDHGGFYKEKTETFTVYDKENGYLYTNGGYVFFAGGADVMLLTDNGEWHRFDYNQIPAQGTVKITHYTFAVGELWPYYSDGVIINTPKTLCVASVIYVS
jgi:hypothetical protein